MVDNLDPTGNMDPTGHDKLREAIGELRRAIASLASVDVEDQKLLSETLDDIRTALDHGTASQAESDSIFRRLNEAARRFEDSHPTLSGAVGGLVDAIGRMGI